MKPARLQLASKFILFQIHCAAGVLVQGGAPDLLLIISQACETKELWAQHLPHSNLRMKFFYPSRKRIPSADVSAAIRALANPTIASAVALRRAKASQSSTVCALACAGELCDATAEGGAVGVDVVFSQAGVVAPPDSLTGETFTIYGDVGKRV